MAIRTELATVCGRFEETAARHAAQPAIRTRGDGVAWTWAQYAERADAGAAGLHALGLRRGDTLACWLTNRPEFHVADAAAMQLGAASFSVYNTFTADQAEHVLGDAGCRIVVTEPAFLERVLDVRSRGTTAVDHVIVVDGGAPEAIGWDEVVEGGDPAFDLEACRSAVRPDDLATLIYTSGTTGPPKGVQLTHANVVAQVAALGERLRFADGLRAVSFLPMAHIAERMCTHYFPMFAGWQVTCCPEPAQIAAYLPEVRPGFFFSPPRLWEKLRAAVLAQAEAPVRSAIDAAVAAVRAGDGPQDGPVQQAIRAKLGLDELDVAIVGAAPCPPDVIEFWHALGVRLSELYGMSETTGVATVSPPEAIRIGTVGTPLDVCEVRLGDDGEVLMRGPVVMQGYRNLPDRTAEALDADGWLHSGDVGEFDADGYLRIVDRIKELIINAAGKNMSPANIEATLKSASPLIGQACAIGDGRPFNVALLTLEPEAARAWAARNGVAGDDLSVLVRHPDLLAAIAAAVDAANARLARVEQIKRFRLLDVEWLPGEDELTPTMKLKRKPIAAKYAADIDALYAGAIG